MKLILAFAAGVVVAAYYARSEYVGLAWRLLLEPPSRGPQGGIDFGPASPPVI